MKAIRTWAACVLALALTTVASAHQQVYTTPLSGPAEAPPNASLGTGTATVTIDFDLVTMRVQASFSGLTGNVTAAHIHCCTTDAGAGTVGVATMTPTFLDFPSGGTSGTYDKTFDLTQASSFNAAFVTNNGGTVSGALNALVAGLDSGKAYFNVHSSQFPGGEVRGFLTAVPEPASASLLGLGALAAVSRLRRRR